MNFLQQQKQADLNIATEGKTDLRIWFLQNKYLLSANLINLFYINIQRKADVTMFMEDEYFWLWRGFGTLPFIELKKITRTQNIQLKKFNEYKN